MEVEAAGKMSSGEAQETPLEELARKLPDGQKLDQSMFLELQAAFEEELKSRELLCQELSVIKVANQTFASKVAPRHPGSVNTRLWYLCTGTCCSFRGYVDPASSTWDTCSCATVGWDWMPPTGAERKPFEHWPGQGRAGHASCLLLPQQTLEMGTNPFDGGLPWAKAARPGPGGPAAPLGLPRAETELLCQNCFVWDAAILPTRPLKMNFQLAKQKFLPVTFAVPVTRWVILHLMPLWEMRVGRASGRRRACLPW
ncbi:hypothetical protein Chor_001896 [Crotalus horridus]